MADCSNLQYRLSHRSHQDAPRAGTQAFVLCPTTLLAKQHAQLIAKRLAPFGHSVQLLNRYNSSKERATTLAAIADGSLNVCVGTQSLLGSEVDYSNVSLLIIDEEQVSGLISEAGNLRNGREGKAVCSLPGLTRPSHGARGFSGGVLSQSESRWCGLDLGLGIERRLPQRGYCACALTQNTAACLSSLPDSGRSRVPTNNHPRNSALLLILMWLLGCRGRAPEVRRGPEGVHQGAQVQG